MTAPVGATEADRLGRDWGRLARLRGVGAAGARAILIAALVGLTMLASTAQASTTGGIISARFCEPSRVQTAAEQDRVLRFAALIREDLDERGDEVMLISRAGIDLSRVGLRYSHSGVLLERGDEGPDAVPWSVRQLYFDCDLGRPRIYDQGLAGFLINAEQPDLGFVSVVLLPAGQARELLAAAQDRDIALDLLGGQYSANAYPFSTRYQNCNQWVVELLATAWAPLNRGELLRERAQSWLGEVGYAPQPLVLDSHLTKFAASFMPLIHLDDHPEDERVSLVSTVTLPVSIEAFVRTRVPDARRIEYCHDTERAVVREGWTPIGNSCEPADGDRVVSLQ